MCNQRDAALEQVLILTRLHTGTSWKLADFLKRSKMQARSEIF